MTYITTHYFHSTRESVQKCHMGLRLKQSNLNNREEGRTGKKLQTTSVYTAFNVLFGMQLGELEIRQKTMQGKCSY